MARHTLPHERAGRHRFGRADRVYCRDMPAVREFYAMHSKPRRWFRLLSTRRARHSFAWFAATGERAKPAFALVMSL